MDATSQPAVDAEQQLAESIGAMTLVADGGAAIKTRDTFARPQNLVATTRSSAELRQLLAARFGTDEFQALLQTDASYAAWLGDDRAAVVADEARNLLMFASFVDNEAAFEYRVPTSRICTSLTGSGAALCVRHPIGVSHTGWMAVLGGGHDEAIHLLYAHVSWIAPDANEGKRNELRWRRHKITPSYAADEIGCASIYDNNVALWNRERRTLTLVPLSDTAILVTHDLSNLPAEPVAVAATADHAALVLQDRSVAILWITSGATALITDCPVGPEPAAEQHVPRNPFTGEPLADLVGLGTPDGAADKLRSVQRPVCAAFDEHHSAVLVLGTDKGCALPLSFIDGGVRPLNPQQLGASAEIDSHTKQNYKFPGLEPPVALRPRAIVGDGMVVTVMPHSMSVISPGALQTQLSGATTRIPYLQERDTPLFCDVAACGHTLLGHTLPGNKLFIGSTVPSPSGRVARYEVAPPLQEGEAAFARATAPYRSIYLSLAQAHVLMPDGRIVSITPSSELDNAAYVRDALKHSLAAPPPAGTTLTAAAAAQ